MRLFGSSFAFEVSTSFLQRTIPLRSLQRTIFLQRANCHPQALSGAERAALARPGAKIVADQPPVFEAARIDPFMRDQRRRVGGQSSSSCARWRNHTARPDASGSWIAAWSARKTPASCACAARVIRSAHPGASSGKWPANCGNWGKTRPVLPGALARLPLILQKMSMRVDNGEIAYRKGARRSLNSPAQMTQPL